MSGIPVKLNDYRICKPSVLKAYEKGGAEEVSIMCVTLMCPIIAACYYCAEEFGMQKDLVEKINALTKFYGYDNIIGYEEKE